MNVGPDHIDSWCCLTVKIALTTPYVRPNSVCGRVPSSVLLYVQGDSVALRPRRQCCFTSKETVLLYVQGDSVALRPRRQCCFTSKETVLLYVHRDSTDYLGRGRVPVNTFVYTIIPVLEI